MPPHANQLREIINVKTCCYEIKDTIGRELSNTIKDTINSAIDEKVKADGGINAAILEQTVHAMETRIMTRLDQLNPAGGELATRPRVEIDEVDAPVAPVKAVENQFTYAGRCWSLPQNFKFPKEVNRMDGWRMWLCGKVVVYDKVAYKTKPFRKLQPKHIYDKSMQQEFKGKWKPIYTLMEESLANGIPDDVDEAFVQASFNEATEHLKNKVSYVWNNAKDERALATWAIGTWSRKVARSEIEKCGTASDKAQLPAKTKYNKPHNAKRSFTIYGDATPDGTIRVNKVARRKASTFAAAAEVTEAFENAFG